MINNLLRYIKSDSARTLPKWERLDADLTNRQSIQMLRFLNVELPDTPNVVLLEQMIKTYIDDIKELVYVKDNFSRCAHLMGPRLRLFMEQRLDSIRAQPFFLKTFIYPNGQKSAVESVIPVTYMDPLRDLPLTSWEDPAWNDLKPVRIWWTTSKEFVSNLVPEARPRFLHDPPSVAIITVDFLLLTLKLLNYIDENRLAGAERISIRNFLRDEVFFHQHEDLRHIWMINFINEIMECESEVAVIELCKSYRDNRFAIQDYSVYALELFGFLQDMKDGGIDPSHLLHAKLLGSKSIIERVVEAQNQLCVRDLRQYGHLDLSINITNLKLLVKFLIHSKNKALKRSIAVDLERDIRLLKRTRIQLQYRSKTLRAWLEQELNDLDFLLVLLRTN